MTIHPVAGLFPMLSGQEISDLAADIKTNGLQQAIVMQGDTLLDGRNRLEACRLAGVEPRFTEYTGDSPVAFIIGVNLLRRHLDKGQRIALGIEIEPHFAEELKRNSGTRTDLLGKCPIRSEPARDQAARAVGLSGKTLSAAKAIKASAPEKFQEIIDGNLSVAQAKREIKRADHMEKIARAGSIHAEVNIVGPFGLVLADPPWKYDHQEAENRAIENHYGTASVVDIIGHSPATESDAVLFLWATAPKLLEAIEVMQGWGFRYVTHAIWDKKKIGMGYWFRGRHELLLVGVKGNPGSTPECERCSSIFEEPRGQHSTKPECVYSWIERAFPDKKKLEMYCREPRKGWAAWGNEV
jgi:N6-adenosine-specific RNA methylase IME4